MSLWMMPAESSCRFAHLAGCLDVRSQARFLALLGAPCSPAAVAPSPVGCGRPASPTSSARPMPCPGRSADARRGWRPWRLCGRCCHGWGRDSRAGRSPGRHAHQCDRAVRGRRRRPPQPDAGAGRAGVRLRARLGDAGLGGATPAVGEHRPAAAGEPVHAAKGRAGVAAGVRLGLPHQAGLAAELLRWLAAWLGRRGVRLWLAVDGAYARREVLREARRDQVTVVSRPAQGRRPVRPAGAAAGRPAGAARDLRPAAHRPGQAGRPTPGLADGGVRPVRPERDRVLQDVPGDVAAGRRRHPRGAGAAGQGVGGVLPHRPGGVRGGRADGGGGSGGHRAGVPRPQGGVGAGRQQLRDVYANVGAFHLNPWLHTPVELWAWGRPEGRLIDRRASPWDDRDRRPSHADRRRAVRRESLRQEYRAAGGGGGQAGNIAGWPDAYSKWSIEVKKVPESAAWNRKVYIACPKSADACRASRSSRPASTMIVASARQSSGLTPERNSARIVTRRAGGGGQGGGGRLLRNGQIARKPLQGKGVRQSAACSQDAQDLLT